jgi:alpha-glucosidase
VWWRNAVVYQIYPRSFADANGDGIGDLNGVRSKFGYLATRGNDAIWLSPFYRSPQADFGYDVADYRDVDPAYGTLDDAHALIAEAHEHDLRVIVDLVPNHTSDQHAWFQAALGSEPGSRERERFLFRDGRGPDGAQPPNNWTSSFGGPAWTRLADGQWYLHLFAPEQPDLNWTNPEVLAEFHDILRFWLDLGVDGFRIDVAHGLAKDPDLADVSGAVDELRRTGTHPHWDRDEVHDVYRGWRQIIDAYGDDRVFVAEAWVPNPLRFAQYLRPDELHTAFNFDFYNAGWDATALRKVIEQTLIELASVGATPTWVLENHDVQRTPTRFGGGELGLRRAKAATLLMLALPGGAYLYQGEELGLEEVTIPPELRVDPVFRLTGGARIGRDGCRVPLPWSGTEPPYGFGPSGTPWLPQPSTWASVTVAAEDSDPSSTLSFYREALRIRRTTVAGADAAIEWLDAEDGVLAFRRGRDVVVVANAGESPADLPELVAGDTPVISTAPSEPGTIAGNATAWFVRPNG